MLIDRFIGCLFLCLCALLWFVIIPQQISGEEQAMYPRLTIIFLAIPALFMALRTTGKNISLIKDELKQGRLTDMERYLIQNRL
ncbi:hypothetical protein, partial [Bilophila wadsworthia]|uniref:hypothetical protein n=1 Tax=Bilophila wadsworthia TaxID=35833 RepID=UPI003AB404A9